MRVFFVRHGESEANRLGIHSNRGWKHPLTATGRAQIEACAGRFGNRNVVGVYASPIRRAVESAEILSGRLRVPFEIEPALAEFDVGVFEDRAVATSRADYDEIERRWCSGSLDARLPGGESCEEIGARLLPFIDRLIRRHAESDQSLVLVGHGGTFRHGLPMVLGNLSRAFTAPRGLGHAACVEAELRSGALVCVRWDESEPG
jgi:probable phosphoglycerate mutase